MSERMRSIAATIPLPKAHAGGCHGTRTSLPPGETMVLLSQCGRALFVWLKNTIERYDHQTGVNCIVFRNEGAGLSSVLIREADELAWQRWPGERHFTYVDDLEDPPSNPGLLFHQSRAGSELDETLTDV